MELSKSNEIMDIAVLFLVFNRLETTKKVFERIRETKPSKLYIAADGARINKVGELEKVNSVREFITSNIDWECEINTLFRNENLGCKNSVNEAINWFFDMEEMGIILEDDCVPNQSFFQFCQELLNRYKDDRRVWNIGGYKHDFLNGDKNSYTFSKYTHIWGWASWADRWKENDVTLSKYKQNPDILFDYDFFHEKFENDSRKEILNSVVSDLINTWDYQWNFTVRINNGLSIRPCVNLIENIGYGEEATHTTGSNEEVKSNPTENMHFPLTHPNMMMIYRKDDALFADKNFKNSFSAKLQRKIKSKLGGKT